LLLFLESNQNDVENVCVGTMLSSGFVQKSLILPFLHFDGEKRITFNGLREYVRRFKRNCSGLRMDLRE
jgi:hypothetical protein